MFQFMRKNDIEDLDEEEEDEEEIDLEMESVPIATVYGNTSSNTSTQRLYKTYISIVLPIYNIYITYT